MLQNTEYRVGPYLKWYWQTQNFGKVMYRRHLEPTKAARLLRLALYAGILAEVAAGALLIWLGLEDRVTGGVPFGAAVIIAYPVVWAHLVALPLELGRLLIVKPRQGMIVKQSRTIF